MTKRRFERDLSKLNDEVLGNLSVEDRLTERLNAINRQPDQAEKLDETAPREDKSIRDPEYVFRRLAADRLLVHIVTDLHRALLEFRWRKVSEALLAFAVSPDGTPIDGEPDADLALWDLAERRIAYGELVPEELGVDLDIFLAGDSRGPSVLDDVDSTLDQYLEDLEASVLEYADHILEYEDDADADAHADADDTTDAEDDDSGGADARAR